MSKEAFELTLDTGTYDLCSCGHKNVPYCNGSHAGIGLQPLVLELSHPRWRFLVYLNCSGREELLRQVVYV